jgi:DNA-binding response OmpR family regulator
MNVACCIRTDAIRRQFQDALRRHHVDVLSIAGEPAAPVWRHPGPELVIVELQRHADDVSLFTWCKRYFAADTPMLAIGSAIAPVRVARAFDSGIDDFWDCPLDQTELDARLRALLRRHRLPAVHHLIEHEGFVLDRTTGGVRDRGRAVELTTREFAIAWLLFSAPGRFVARAEICAVLQDAAGVIADRTIEQTVQKLRTKLALGPQRGAMLRGAGTRGYRLMPTAP